MEGTPIDQSLFDTKRVLVLGSEAEGISKRAKTKIDEMISITMQREFDSLNVSAAGAILIHRMSNAVK